MVYGYARISTAKQSLERQLVNLSGAFPGIKIYQEAYTGTKISRPEWDKLLSRVTPGDTIVFDSVSRMSRNADDGVRAYFALYDRGIDLVFLKERHIDTAVFREAAERQVEDVTTGDAATDELTAAITRAVNTYMVRLAEKQIRIAFEQAEKEVSDLRQRTREGLQAVKARAKEEGRENPLGRQQGTTIETKKAKAAKDAIRTHSKSFGGTLDDKELLALCGISRNSLYKYKREIKAEE